MPHANEIFWPELHPGSMPPHFNDYPQLLLAEGDSWFAWAWMGVDVSPSILTELKFDRRTATLCYAYSGHTSGEMAAMAMSAGFMQELSARRFSEVDMVVVVNVCGVVRPDHYRRVHGHPRLQAVHLSNRTKHQWHV